MSETDREIGFVLSPSRTGTVFLSHALAERFPEICWLHEPSPARLEVILGNLRNDLGLGRWLVRRLFLRLRHRRLAQIEPGGRCIEINPMLCPLTDLLPAVPGPLRVVHMVRDPRTWVQSILAFKASGYRRYLIDYVPFATPYPSPRPRGWRQLGPAERALWRWTHCNRQILAIKPQCARYCLTRYEDLFDADPAVRGRALKPFLDTFDLPSDDDLSWFRTERRINAAPKAALDGQSGLDESTLESVCGDLLDEFGYRQPQPRP